MEHHPNSRDHLSSYEVACSCAICDPHQKKGASLALEMSVLDIPSLIQGIDHAHEIPLRFLLLHRGLSYAWEDLW